jgi:hypothetical protein
MAEKLTASDSSAGSGLESRRGPRASRIMKVVADAGGAIDGDTSRAFKVPGIRRPTAVIGPYAAAFNGEEVTLTALAAQADTETVYIEIIGRTS